MAAVDDGVVALAVSPGEADGEVEVGGAGEEGGFGGFSATLTGGGGCGVEGNDSGGIWEREVFPAVLDQNCGCIEISHDRKGAAVSAAPGSPSYEIDGLKHEKRGPEAALF